MRQSIYCKNGRLLRWLGTHRMLLTIWLCVMGFGGGLIILTNTPWGVGVWHDSTIYLNAAGNFAQGQGLQWVGGGGELKPLTHFPPLYPMFLASVILLGVEVADAARWLAAVFFGVNICIVGFIVLRYTHKPWVAMAISLLAMVSPVLVSVHSMAMSEPLFILLGLVSIAFLVEHLVRPRKWLLLSAAIAAALTYLTRYAGAALVMTGVVSLLLLGGRSRRVKIRDAINFAVLALLPMLAWMIRNLLLTGSATNRILQFHPPDLNKAKAFINTISAWLLPPNVPLRLRAAVLVVGLLFLIVMALRLWSKVESPATKRDVNLTVILCLYGGLYLMLLTASLTFFDAATRMDDRILSLIFTAVLILISLFVGLAQTPRKVGLLLLPILIVGWGALTWTYLAGSTEILSTMRREGVGFSSRAWQSSEIIAWIEKLPSNALIYLNEAFAINFLIGRGAFSVPEKIDPLKSQPKVDYETQIAAMHNQLSKPSSLLVLFHPHSLRIEMPSLEELTAGLVLLVEAQDGAIYVDPINAGLVPGQQ